MNKYVEKKLMTNSYPASRANAEGSNNISMDSANNVGLE